VRKPLEIAARARVRTLLLHFLSCARTSTYARISTRVTIRIYNFTRSRLSLRLAARSRASRSELGEHRGEIGVMFARHVAPRATPASKLLLAKLCENRVALPLLVRIGSLDLDLALARHAAVQR
jgi:hypothetical protein